ncbi:MAG: hypothetical protein AB1941_02155 [Gemmatimonadota bacterium]
MIDLAFREQGGWVIADYKTGAFDAAGAGSATWSWCPILRLAWRARWA